MKQNSKTWLIAAGLVAVAVAWRVMNWQNSVAPNLELVTATCLVAAAFLGRKAAIAVPLAAMAISDLIIGNSMILLFTWSAFAIIGLSGLALRRWSNVPVKLMGASVIAAIGGSAFFFVFTNFGVWFLGDGTMYAKTWAGLMQCYAMGLPFYRTMLVGNLVLVPAAFGLALAVRAQARSLAARRDDTAAAIVS